MGGAIYDCGENASETERVRRTELAGCTDGGLASCPTMAVRFWRGDETTSPLNGWPIRVVTMARWPAGLNAVKSLVSVLRVSIMFAIQGSNRVNLRFKARSYFSVRAAGMVEIMSMAPRATVWFESD